MKPEEITEDNWVEALIEHLERIDAEPLKQPLSHLMDDDAYNALWTMRQHLPQSQRREV